jgi:hypothetical protein
MARSRRRNPQTPDLFQQPAPANADGDAAGEASAPDADSGSAADPTSASDADSSAAKPASVTDTDSGCAGKPASAPAADSGSATDSASAPAADSSSTTDSASAPATDSGSAVDPTSAPAAEGGSPDSRSVDNPAVLLHGAGPEGRCCASCAHLSFSYETGSRWSCAHQSPEAPRQRVVWLACGRYEALIGQ